MGQVIFRVTSFYVYPQIGIMNSSVEKKNFGLQPLCSKHTGGAMWSTLEQDDIGIIDVTTI